MLTLVRDRTNRDAAVFQDECSSVYIHVPKIPHFNITWRHRLFAAIGVKVVGDGEAAVTRFLLVLIFADFHHAPVGGEHSD